MKKLVTNVMILVFGFLMLGTVSSYAQWTPLEMDIQQMREEGMESEEIFEKLKIGGATETVLCFASVRLGLPEAVKEMITKENVNVGNGEGATPFLIAIQNRVKIEKYYEELFLNENQESVEESVYNEETIHFFSKMMNESLTENMEIIEYLMDMNSGIGKYNGYWAEKLQDSEDNDKIKAYVIAKEESLELDK